MGDEKKDEPKKEEKKDTEEVKKDEPKAEEKKDEAKDDVIEIVEEKKAEEPKVEEVPELDYVSKLEKFVEFINWDHTDAAYYLKEVRPKKILSKENQNDAMTKMLESFVAYDGKQQFKIQQKQIRPQSPMNRQMGPKSTQQQQRGRPVQKR